MFESLFPSPPKYKTASSASTPAGPGLKKIERGVTLSPAFTAAGTPAGATKQYTGTAIAFTVPKGATKCEVMRGFVEPVPGIGTAADLTGVSANMLSSQEIRTGLTEADTFTLTPEWEAEDDITLATGKVRVSYMLFWF